MLAISQRAALCGLGRIRAITAGRRGAGPSLTQTYTVVLSATNAAGTGTKTLTLTVTR